MLSKTLDPFSPTTIVRQLSQSCLPFSLSHLNLKATAAYILLMFLLVGLSVSLLIDLSTGKLYRGADCAGRQGRAGSLTLRQL